MGRKNYWKTLNRSDYTPSKELFIYSHLNEIKKKLKKWMSNGHYNILPTLELGADYNVVFGEKSNGKSTAVQMLAIIIKYLYNKDTVLLRLYQEDFRAGMSQAMFGGVPTDFIKDVTNGEYNCIKYKDTKWFLAYQDPETYDIKLDPNGPFCYKMWVLNAPSSIQFPNVELIMYDEFIKGRNDLPNEVVQFVTVISTIVRLKSSVTIYMLGNTVNTYSSYFEQLELTNVRKMKQGDIDTYYSENGGRRVCEYAPSIELKKKNNKLYDFKNPKLEMIKTGVWRIDMYPHLTISYRPKDIVFKFYIIFDKRQFIGEIIAKGNDYCLNIRKLEKSDAQPNKDKDIIYTDKADTRLNISNDIFKPIFDVQCKIVDLFRTNRVFYENNTIGDTVKAFINSAGKQF